MSITNTRTLMHVYDVKICNGSGNLTQKYAEPWLHSLLVRWSVPSFGRSLSLYKWRAPFSYVINRAARRRGGRPKWTYVDRELGGGIHKGPYVSDVCNIFGFFCTSSFVSLSLSHKFVSFHLLLGYPHPVQKSPRHCH